MLIAMLAATVISSPIVIAHRGASGERPEHTLMAYELAIDQGADYIEPDLVLTKDGVLVARHENEISGTTDVATKPEFADRKKTKSIDGASVTGWFTEDFTLAELKTLRAKERLPQVRSGNRAWDGKEAVPTLQEVIDLVKRKEKATGRRIGLYPETKHPSYFEKIGLPFEEPLLSVLASNGYRDRQDPVFIQSFEVGNLKKLSKLTRLNLVQLMYEEDGPADLPGTTYASMATKDGLKEIATYAQGIGVSKPMVIPVKDGTLATPTTLVADAKANGLIVHVWTFRNENLFLPKSLAGKPQQEIEAFLKTGIDGIFTDFPATGVAAMRAYRGE